MKSNQANLLLLLQLSENCLSETDAAQARKLLSDPAVRSRWRLLQQASRLDPLADFAAVDVDAVPAESIAALVERQLPADEALRVESACWQSLPALREVVSTFRFMGRNKPQAVNPALTNRLLHILPADKDDHEIEPPLASLDQVNPQSKRANGHQVSWPTRVSDSIDLQAVDRANDELARASVLAAARRRQGQTNRLWMYAAAAAIVIICLGGLALIWTGAKEDRMAAPKHGDVKDKGQDRSPIPKRNFVENERRDPGGPLDAPDPQDNPPLKKDDELFTDGNNLKNELNLPEDWHWSDDWLVREEDDIDPRVVKQPIPPRRPIAVDWDRIEGILAAWDEGSGKWHGVNYQVGKVDSTFATLPDSWASTVPGSFGRLVLAADTEVSFGEDSAESSGIDVSVIRGRVALHDLPSDQGVTVRIGNAHWTVRAARPKSIVSVDLTSAHPRFFVPRGEVLIDGKLLGTRQQISWTSGRWDAPRSLGRENTSWTDRPVAVARVSGGVQRQLLTSSDMRRDLTTLKGLDSRLATRWSLAIAPQDAYERMSSPDTGVRIEAIKWLLSLHPRDRRVTRALRQFLAPAGNPRLVRSMSNWIQAMRENRAPKTADAQQLVLGLEHSELAIRHFSAYLLELAFPQRRNAYEPQAPPQLRKASAEQWRRYLEAQMRASAQQQQQVGATRGAAANRAARPNQQPNRANKNANNPRRPAQNRAE